MATSMTARASALSSKGCTTSTLKGTAVASRPAAPRPHASRTLISADQRQQPLEFVRASVCASVVGMTLLLAPGSSEANVGHCKYCVRAVESGLMAELEEDVLEVLSNPKKEASLLAKLEADMIEAVTSPSLDPEDKKEILDDVKAEVERIEQVVSAEKLESLETALKVEVISEEGSREEANEPAPALSNPELGTATSKEQLEEERAAETKMLSDLKEFIEEKKEAIAEEVKVTAAAALLSEAEKVVDEVVKDVVEVVEVKDVVVAEVKKAVAEVKEVVVAEVVEVKEAVSQVDEVKEPTAVQIAEVLMGPDEVMVVAAASTEQQ